MALLCLDLSCGLDPLYLIHAHTLLATKYLVQRESGNSSKPIVIKVSQGPALLGLKPLDRGNPSEGVSLERSWDSPTFNSIFGG